KILPEVVGDGTRSIETLVWAHARYRCQAGMFAARLASEWRRVPSEGERVVLSSMGNHAQGCMFVDAPELITPELERAVVEIAAAFPGGLDVGRFDLRFADEVELCGGRGFGVVEVNGVTSEPTNMYDPGRSPLFAWRLLSRQWSIAYRLGSARRAEGRRPMRVAAAFRLVLGHLRARPRTPGSSDR
ncbi:MAG: hypothetical protein AAGF47_12555, partial [Planctomycetota bacterium]